MSTTIAIPPSRKSDKGLLGLLRNEGRLRNEGLPCNEALFLKDAVESAPKLLDSTEPDTRAGREAKREKVLLCRKCRAAITSESEALEVNGEHFHTFFNPAGIIYEIRCFKQAPGCLVHGEPSGEFSWFSEYCWQYSLCARCLGHLGWFFTGPARSFHGLIHNRLV